MKRSIGLNPNMLRINEIFNNLDKKINENDGTDLVSFKNNEFKERMILIDQEINKSSKFNALRLKS